jgi:hypothetical protein
MESCLSPRMKLALLIVLAMSCFGCASRQGALLDDGAIVEAFLGGYRSLVSSPQSSVVTGNQNPQKTMIQLEAEELRIRNEPNLSRAERMQKLRAIWDQQLVLMGKK